MGIGLYYEPKTCQGIPNQEKGARSFRCQLAIQVYV